MPTDPAEASLIVLGFRRDDAAEPVADGIALHTLTWSIGDEEAVLDALEGEDLWELSSEQRAGLWWLVARWPGS